MQLSQMVLSLVTSYTKEPGKYKIVEGTDYGVDNFAVGFRKDDTALRDKINGILAEMKKDGTADKIVEKWLGSSADLDKTMLNSTIRDILIVLWSVLLQQIIKERMYTREEARCLFSSRGFKGIPC